MTGTVEEEGKKKSELRALLKRAQNTQTTEAARLPRHYNDSSGTSLQLRFVLLTIKILLWGNAASREDLASSFFPEVILLSCHTSNNNNI